MKAVASWMLVLLCIATDPVWAEDLESPITEFSDFLSKPLQWNEHQWLQFGAVAAGIGLAYHYDENIRHHFNEGEHNGFTDGMDSAGPLWSEYKISGPLMLGLYTYGTWSGNTRYARAGLNMLEATMLSLGTVETIKKSSYRCRPSTTAQSDQWFKPDCGYSFISGHTTRSFAMASALSNSLDLDWRLNSLVYGLAAAGAYSRLYKNKHWLSDVVGGMALGVVSGRYVVAKNRRRSRYRYGSARQSRAMRIYPFVGDELGWLGISLVKPF